MEKSLNSIRDLNILCKGSTKKLMAKHASLIHQNPADCNSLFSSGFGPTIVF